jgi:hypothetical protein
MGIELPVKVRLTGQQEVQAGLNQLQSSWNLQAKAISGMVGALGATAVFAGALSFLKAAHTAAQDSRTSITLLTAQLGFYSSALVKQSEVLSKKLFIDEGDILKADQRLLLYTREEASIKKLIPGIIDLAKVKGIDLTTAATAVGLALKRADEAAIGHVITIRGLGVAFKATGTEAGNVAALEAKLESAVGGSAQAVADSLDGWSKLGYWTEKITHDFGRMIFGLSKAEEKNNAYKQNVAMLADNQKELAKVTEASKTSNTYYGESIVTVKERIENNITALKAQVDAYENVDKIAKETATNNAKNAEAAEETDKLQAEADNLTLERKKNKLLKEKEQAISIGVSVALANEVFGAKIAKIDEEITKKKEEELKKQQEDVNKTVKAEEKAFEEIKKQQEDNARETYENQKKAAEEKQRFDEEQQAATDNIGILEINAIKNRFTRQEVAIKKEHNKELVELKKYLALKLITQKQYSDAIALIQKIEKDEIAKMRHEGQEQALGETVRNLGIIASKHKEFVIAYKLAAIAQATIDTYKSAESVYAGFSTIPIIGQGLGIAGAAIAIAAGLANVQMIAAQKMAYGGVVTGGVPGQDSVPAMLMPGEIVYNPAHPNPVLSSIISEDNSTTSSHHYHISMPITVHGNPTNTTVAKIGEVTERAVINALKRAQNLGKISAPGLVLRS